MEEPRPLVDQNLLLAAFRHLTPENQIRVIEFLKALAPSEGQKSDSDESTH